MLEAAIACVLQLPPDATHVQLHPELSPAAWHLGHMGTVENFWVREQVAGQPLSVADKALWFPELTPKSERAARLPALAEIVARVRADHAHNRALLRAGGAHPLLAENYLPHFLLQHHAQHVETLQQIRLQHWRQSVSDLTCPIIEPCALAPQFVEIPTVVFEAGNAGVEAFDNECPRHRVALAPYAIAAHAVTNGAYLGFMQAGGYRERRYWSHAGWRWRNAAQVAAPHYWRATPHGWRGPAGVTSDSAVFGISYYEAEAFAHYAGARLPHEHEWEYAASNGLIVWGGAWEWCANAFYPYPGFTAFPYVGYSQPWFDGAHRTLRGASRFTPASIRRAAFRNFYPPTHRHVFAGIRLAAAAHQR